VLLPRPKRESVNIASNAYESASPPVVLADIKCEAPLGGLLKHFYRVAA
jgi:hypothetical protein